MNVFRLFVCLLCFCGCTSLSLAGTYYVDNSTGNDANDGLSWTTAWKTLSKPGASLVAGDTVVIRKTAIPYNLMTVVNSGTAANPITIRGEDTVEIPLITGAVIASGWSESSVTGVWKGSTSVSPLMVVVNNEQQPKATSSSCVDGKWFWEGNVFYYKNGLSTPPTEQVWRQSMGGGLQLHNVSYVNVKDVGCWVGGGACISVRNSHHITGENIHSTWMWRGVDISQNAFLNTFSRVVARGNQDGIYISGGAHLNDIIDCDVQYNGNAPLWTSGDRAGVAVGDYGSHRGNRIDGCEIAYNGGARSDTGLVIYEGPQTIVTNNHVHHNYNGGVMITMNSWGTHVEGNIIEENGQLGVQAGGKGITGITIRHGSYRTTVWRNIIRNNYVAGGTPWENYPADEGRRGGLDVRDYGGRKFYDIDMKENTVTGTVGGPNIYIRIEQ